VECELLSLVLVGMSSARNNFRVIVSASSKVMCSMSMFVYINDMGMVHAQAKVNNH